jgi:hypothetical protein
MLALAFVNRREQMNHMGLVNSFENRSQKNWLE